MNPITLEEGWPAELRDVHAYLPYQLRPRASGRLGKCPVRWAGARLYPVSSQATAYHLRFAEALDLWQFARADGIGLVLDERVPVVGGQPLCALDLDDVIVDGQLLPDAAALVDELQTYTEVSVSGSGLHLLAAGAVAVGARRGRVKDLTAELITTGFLAITGVRWPETPAGVAPRPAELAQVRGSLESALPPPCSSPIVRPVADVLSALLEQRNGPKVRRLLIDGDTSGYPSPSEAVFAAARLIAWRTHDAGVIEALLRESPLYASRWERPVAAGRTWITYTAHRAMSADFKGGET